MRRSVRAVARTSACAAGLAAAAGALVWSGPPSFTITAATAGSSAETAEAGIAGVAALAAWVVLTWLVVASSVSMASRLPGAAGRIADLLSRRIAPAALRRAIDLALGVAVTAAVVAPSTAYAAVRPAARVAAVAQTVHSAAAPSQLGDRISTEPAALRAVTHAPDVDFDRPAMGTPPARRSPVGRIGVVGGRTPRRTEPAAGSGVVVHRGDSLWSIAARELGAGATAAQIDARWRRWYAANRAVVGSDPDRISPGLQLVRPAAPDTAAKTTR